MADTKCKTCRREGQKLFLKEEKCTSHKCPFSKKPYAPGKKLKKPKQISEYGVQLKEKQKLKFFYGLRERAFVNYVHKSMKKGGSGISQRLLQLLESRLDNAVFRSGLAQSRSAARQIVGHGHISVNGRKTDIPSLRIKKGDKISIRPQSVSRKVFSDLDVNLKKYSPPVWIRLDKETREAEIIGEPINDNTETGANISKIIEFYSR